MRRSDGGDVEVIVVGMDVGREQHLFHVINQEKKALEAGILPNASWAFKAWFIHIEETFGEEVVLALETRNGLATPLDQLAEQRGWKVVAIPPDAVKTYRETVLRVHSKTDANDAMVLAYLALDLAGRRQAGSFPRRKLLRATRLREHLVRDQTRLKNRLRKGIASYWPEVTQQDVFYRLDLDYVLLLLEHAPDPARIAALGPAGLLKFFRKHRSRVSSNTVEKIVALARQNSVTAEEKAVVLEEVRIYARRLRELVKDIRRVETIMDRLAADDGEVQTLATVRGVSLTQASTFVAEIQNLANFQSEAKLASYAGFALKRHQSGTTVNTCRPQVRANQHLKRVVFLMADTMRLNNERAKQYYARKIGEGKTHRQALRALGRHLIRMFYAMLKTGRPYAPGGPLKEQVSPS